MTNPINDPFAAFKILDFRRFIFSKFMSTLALQIQFVVINWQVYAITKDALSLGLLGLIEVIPAVLFALYGGLLADRYNKKYILITCVATYLVASIVLLYTDNFLSQDLLWPYYLVMFLIGVTRGFYSPSQFALMTQLVPREAFANSAAWNSTFWHIAVVAGSTLGGLLLGFAGLLNTDLLISFLIVLSVVQLFIIKFDHHPNEQQHAEPAMKSIRKGLHFVFSDQRILGAMTLDLIAVLFGGATALLPIFADQVLHVDEKGFGVLRAAPFVGAVIMALLMTKYPPVKNAGKKLLFSVGAFACCMILFALSKNFYLSVCILVLSGAFDNVSVVIRSTIIQLFTPDHMRGRVSSVSTMFISSSNELGAFESGVAAKLLGLTRSVIIGGSIALTSVWVATLKLPALKNLDLSDTSKH